MILHCSQNLAARLSGVSSFPLEETSPLGSWHGHLFTLDRRQCAMFCHDETRYVLFFSGLLKADFAELDGKWFRPLYLATLGRAGCSDTQIRKVGLALGPMRFDTVTNRSVQGSLRVAKQDLEVWLHSVPNVMDLDPLAMSCRLNERPSTVYGKWVWPGRAMLDIVACLS